MIKRIHTVAFDVGGVLAYQDLSVLTEEERFLLKTYMNRSKIDNKPLVEYAQSRMSEIYLKIHHLTSEAIPTLEMLKDRKIKTSIWTNNIREIDHWFEEIGLYRYVKKEDIINSFYLGIDKPNIEFYRKALLLLKSIPTDILFLDDNPSNITSAAKCKINAKKYNPKESLKEVVETEIKKGRQL